MRDSLVARGYLRPHKPYSPPEDVRQRLETILQENLGENNELSNGKIKFKVLNACFKEFNHSVPNSLLHKMSTKGITFLFIGLKILKHNYINLFGTDDVRQFYFTTVDVRVPREKFKSIELPPNLHVQYDYHRFHPDTDTFHNGVSAFPGRNTVVTGLTYKKKYAGYYTKPKGY